MHFDQQCKGYLISTTNRIIKKTLQKYKFRNIYAFQFNLCFFFWALKNIIPVFCAIPGFQMLEPGPFYFSSWARRLMEELLVLTHAHVVHTHSDGDCNTCWFCSDRNHKLRAEMLPQIDLCILNRALECTLMCFAEGSLVRGCDSGRRPRRRGRRYFIGHVYMYSLPLTSLLLRRPRQLRCSARRPDIDPYQCFWSETLPNMQAKHRKALPNPEFGLLTLRWWLCKPPSHRAARNSQGFLKNLHVI